MQGLWQQILTRLIDIMICWKIPSEKTIFFNRPMHIFNCDESGLPLNPKILKVVSTVGSKNLHHMCNDTKLQITVLACTSVSGITIPPFVIFDRKTLNPALTAGEVAGTACIPMYSPTTSRSLKCQIKLDTAAEKSLLDETKQDIQSVIEQSFQMETFKCYHSSLYKIYYCN